MSPDPKGSALQRALRRRKLKDKDRLVARDWRPAPSERFFVPKPSRFGRLAFLVPQRRLRLTEHGEQKLLGFRDQCRRRYGYSSPSGSSRSWLTERLEWPSAYLPPA